MTIRCAHYGRVSTIVQEADGESLETQYEEFLAEIARLGPDHEPEPHCIWTEVASGAAGTYRPVLEAVLEDAEAGRFDLLVVHSPDRLSRDAIEMGVLYRQFEMAGVGIHFVHGPASDSPEAMIMLILTGWASGIELGLIRERTMRGRMQLAREGRLPMGSVTYGYDYDPITQQRSINEAEARVVRMMFNRVLGGMNIHQICQTLNDLDIPPKRGRQWWDTTVTQILRNRLYTGTGYYGQKQHRKLPSGKVKTTPQPEEEWMEQPDSAPQFISKELFDRVQKRLNANAEARIPKKPYLLTGFARCLLCWSSVAGAGGTPHRYYQCSHAKRRSQDDEERCSVQKIPADHMEAAVQTAVIGALLHIDKEIGQHLQHLDHELWRELFGAFDVQVVASRERLEITLATDPTEQGGDMVNSKSPPEGGDPTADSEIAASTAVSNRPETSSGAAYGNIIAKDESFEEGFHITTILIAKPDDGRLRRWIEQMPFSRNRLD